MGECTPSSPDRQRRPDWHVLLRGSHVRGVPLTSFSSPYRAAELPIRPEDPFTRGIRMVYRVVLVSLTVLLACGGSTTLPADLVVRDVSVLDVESGDWASDRSIFIAGGDIIAMPSSDTPAPEGAEVVDGRGSWVIPGLWDAHVHSVSNRAWHFPLMLAHGVTGVRNMHTSEPDPWAAISDVREDIRTGDIPALRFIANGPIVDGTPPVWPGSVALAEASEASEVVDSLVAGGADFIKVYDNLTLPAFEAVLARATERGIAVDGHLPLRVPAADAVHLGMRTIEHLTGMVQGCSSRFAEVAAAHTEFLQAPPLPFPAGDSVFLSQLRRLSDSEDETLCTALADTYATSGVSVTPTLINSRSQVDPAATMAEQDASTLLPDSLADQWAMMAGPGPGQMLAGIMRPVVARLPGHVQRLNEAGVPILAGTDAGNLFLVPGASLHDELELLVDAGLSPLEAIRAATASPATVFEVADSLGHVRVGYAADFVLLREDPTRDISAVRQISAVFLRGRHYDRAQLDSLLAVPTARGGLPR